jgi:hypothetical protein
LRSEVGTGKAAAGARGGETGRSDWGWGGEWRRSGGALGTGRRAEVGRKLEFPRGALAVQYGPGVGDTGPLEIYISSIRPMNHSSRLSVNISKLYAAATPARWPGPPNASSSRMRLEGFEGGAASDERPPQPWTTGGSPAGSCPTVARVRRPVNITL